MRMYFDIVGFTVCVIFVDQLSGTSIFRRTYDSLDNLDNDIDSISEDDIINVYDCLKKHPKWRVVLLENQYVLPVSMTQGNVF